MNLMKHLRVRPGGKVCLADWDADDTVGLKKEKSQELLDRNIARMAQLEYRLYAESRQSLLVVLQGMDAAGKDGTIRHVMTGLNPQNCRVTAFKVPSAEERAHDFLWRIHHAVPACGEIGIFNRSHYEDVLVVRVHDLVSKGVWSARYKQINQFEQMLAEGGTTIVKVFLHISKQEQQRRLQSRLDDPKKRRKFSRADLAERRYWDDYQRAYEAAITRCNTEHAPWYIVPANHKWYRNLVISRILRKTLAKMAPQYPPAQEGLDGLVVE